MARIWSACRRGDVRRWHEPIERLWRRADGAFLALASLVHLVVTAAGAGTLIAQASSADETLSGPSPLSVTLFLLTGGLAGLLLLHMGCVTPSAQVASPALRIRTRQKRQRLSPKRPQTLTTFAPSNVRAPHRPASAGPAPASADHRFSGLTSDVSHELRTPLNAIIGFADLMQRELLGPLGSPRYREYARHIRESGLAVLKAAEQTMTLNSLLADRRQPNSIVDLEPVVHEACRLAADEAEVRGIRILHGLPCPASVRAEPKALQQAIASLLDLAVRRAPHGRSIAVSVRCVGGCVRLNVAFCRASSTPGTNHDRAGQSSTGITRALLGLQNIALLETADSISAIFPPNAAPAIAGYRRGRFGVAPAAGRASLSKADLVLV